MNLNRVCCGIGFDVHIIRYIHGEFCEVLLYCFPEHLSSNFYLGTHTESAIELFEITDQYLNLSLALPK